MLEVAGALVSGCVLLSSLAAGQADQTMLFFDDFKSQKTNLTSPPTLDGEGGQRETGDGTEARSAAKTFDLLLPAHQLTGDQRYLVRGDHFARFPMRTFLKHGPDL